MARDGWFDGTGFDFSGPVVEDLGGRLAGFASDCVFSREEWVRQRNQVFGALRELEGGLDDASHASITKILREYEMLLFMTQHVDGVLKWSDENRQLSLF